MEDGCSELGNVSLETVTPVWAVATPNRTKADITCKQRRQLRVEALRAKRAGRSHHRRQGLMQSFHAEAAMVTSSDNSVTTYTLSKDELRRKKNRESAERSRLRKLALIDFLTAQATSLATQLHQLAGLNRRLRCGDHAAVLSSDDGDGDLSTISGSSSPCHHHLHHTHTSLSSASPAGTYVLSSDDSTVSSLSHHQQHQLHQDHHHQQELSFDALDAFVSFPGDHLTTADAALYDVSFPESGRWSPQPCEDFDFDVLLDFDASFLSQQGVAAAVPVTTSDAWV